MHNHTISIGVLIIGSLYWSNSDIRKKWRERLDLNASKHVRTPIRYGRQSVKRGRSYTMVFSGSLREGQFGCGIVVPCKQPVETPEGLVHEAKHLWAAENKSRSTERISAGWGCVGLVRNPDRPMPEVLMKDWRALVAREGNCGYGQLAPAASEKPAVDRHSGFLNVAWPATQDGSTLDLDLLLATATEPTIEDGSYASAQHIADGWTTPEGKKYVSYFWKNRAHGITTFEDAEIEEVLERSTVVPR